MQLKKITLKILHPFWVALKFLGRCLFVKHDPYVNVHGSAARALWRARLATGMNVNPGDGGIGPVPDSTPTPDPLPTGGPTGRPDAIDVAYEKLVAQEQVNA